jgi:hypothetical protein
MREARAGNITICSQAPEALIEQEILKADKHCTATSQEHSCLTPDIPRELTVPLHRYKTMRQRYRHTVKHFHSLGTLGMFFLLYTCCTVSFLPLSSPKRCLINNNNNNNNNNNKKNDSYKIGIVGVQVVVFVVWRGRVEGKRGATITKYTYPPPLPPLTTTLTTLTLRILFFLIVKLLTSLLRIISSM